MPTPKIIDVEPRSDFTLVVSFANKERRLFDVKPYMGSIFFGELRDPDYFKRVEIVWEGSGIEWPNEQDLSRDTLYIEGKEIVRLQVVQSEGMHGSRKPDRATKKGTSKKSKSEVVDAASHKRSGTLPKKTAKSPSKKKTTTKKVDKRRDTAKKRDSDTVEGKDSDRRANKTTAIKTRKETDKKTHRQKRRKK